MELLELKEDNALEILRQFGKEVDEEGYLVDAGSGERVLCRYTRNPLTLENLGGVLPGSDIFISDTDTAYAGYILEFLSDGDGDH